MIVTVKPGADADAVRAALAGLGVWAVRYDAPRGGVYLVVEPHSRDVPAGRLLEIDGVADVAVSPSPHPLVDAQSVPAAVGGLAVGPGAPPVVMAGPCSVESREQIGELAELLARCGVQVLRGGGFKPRSSPYAFQGLGGQALSWLRDAADRHGLSVVSEALGEASVPVVAEHSDLIQIGSRNMHSYALLKRVAAEGKPVLLKRGMSATVEEWLLAAEYCLLHGASAVVFCERGVRGFDNRTRNLLDLASVALLANVMRQPVLVDPSHALGRTDLVLPLARAAIAAGASGLLVEVHDEPARAMSDGPQALRPDDLERLVASLDDDRRTRADLAAEGRSRRGPGRDLR